MFCRVSSKCNGVIIKCIICNGVVLSQRLSFYRICQQCCVKEHSDETFLIFQRSNLIKRGSNKQKSY